MLWCCETFYNRLKALLINEFFSLKVCHRIKPQSFNHKLLTGCIWSKNKDMAHFTPSVESHIEFDKMSFSISKSSFASECTENLFKLWHPQILNLSSCIKTARQLRPSNYISVTSQTGKSSPRTFPKNGFRLLCIVRYITWL